LYFESSTLTRLLIDFPLCLQVAPYKKVRKVEFINAIPKSNTGKILRKELIVKIRLQLEAALEMA